MVVFEVGNKRIERLFDPYSGADLGDPEPAINRVFGWLADLHDNLFEVGASSLKLIEIHEQIDQQFPGQIDLTELFDFPTIAELAAHLEGKLAAQAL